MKIVILGCGRLGSRTALKMSKDPANSVIVVDKSPDAFNFLGKDFPGKVMEGDGASMETYVGVMAEKPDLFMALTANDNTNIMAAEIAKQKYEVQKAIARVSDPVRAKAFEELGIETFCPTVLCEKKLSRIIEATKGKESGDE
jgi:trk system potassium uptake protein